MNNESADLSTDDVIRAVRNGELEAYRQIVARYQGDVLKIVNAMLSNPSTRDDVVQQVFVQAYQNLHQYEIGRGFSQWIKAITRNKVKEELRKLYRYQGRIEAYAKALVDRLEHPDEEKNREVAQIRNSALQECLKTLEGTSADAVKLHYIDGKKTEDVASTVGKSAGAIRTLLYRARGQLRACMEGKGVLG